MIELEKDFNKKIEESLSEIVSLAFTRHWAKTISSKTERVVAWHKPTKTKNIITVLLLLEPSLEEELIPTTASYNWKRYPSQFIIKNESDFDKAIELIWKSYIRDLEGFSSHKEYYLKL